MRVCSDTRHESGSLVDNDNWEPRSLSAGEGSLNNKILRQLYRARWMVVQKQETASLPSQDPSRREIHWPHSAFASP
jgi:hypothetical protein